MWTVAEIRSKLVLNEINHKDLAKECGVTGPELSNVISKTQLILPKLIKILGENPFAVEETECSPEEVQRLKAAVRRPGGRPNEK